MKRVVRAVSAGLGLVLMVNAVFMACVSNFNVGFVMTFVTGAFILTFAVNFDKINALTRCGVLRWMKYAVYAAVVFVLSVIVFIAVYGYVDTVTYDEDVLIVLGAGIHGEAVTYPLMHRLDKAADYAGKNPNAIIVVSGGQGPQESITEALAMERYLIKKGVSGDRIIKEERATSTFENFSYAKDMLDSHFGKPYKAAFVTNGFHIFRASRLADIAGLDAAHLHAKIAWYTVPVSYLREFTGILKLWVLKK